MQTSVILDRVVTFTCRRLWYCKRLFVLRADVYDTAQGDSSYVHTSMKLHRMILLRADDYDTAQVGSLTCRRLRYGTGWLLIRADVMVITGALDRHAAFSVPFLSLSP